MYCKVYKLHICGAIFFNHESPKRHQDYVSKKSFKMYVKFIMVKEKNYI